MKGRRLLELVLLWILISANCQAGGSRARHNYDSVECVVNTSITSPYVRSYIEGSSTLSSQTHSPCINELHVIQLQQLSSEVSRSTAHLSLHLYSTNLTGLVFGGALTLVLASRNPVEWFFHRELIDNHFYVQFWVSDGSRIYGRHVTEASVHKVPARRLETLTNWVENNLGPVTSYTRVPHADHNNSTQYLEIGFERNIENPCPLSPQLATGCLAMPNQGIHNRDLHVIELVNAVSSNGEVVELIIRPAIVRRHRCNLMIVLKSHSMAVWIIETRGLRGTLDIVTEDTLNITQIGMQSVRVIAERLQGLGGQHLVDWTADKYGPPVSYTYVPLADKVELIVDGQDYYSLPSSDLHAALSHESFEVNTPKDDVNTNDKGHQLQLIADKSYDQSYAAETQQYAPCDTSVIYRPGSDVMLVIGIAFAAFCIGCLLIGVLWFIHTHTVSKRKVKLHDEVRVEDISMSLTSKSLTSSV